MLAAAASVLGCGGRPVDDLALADRGASAKANWSPTFPCDRERASVGGASQQDPRHLGREPWRADDADNAIRIAGRDPDREMSPECLEISWGDWKILDPGAPGVLVMRYDVARPHADHRPQLHVRKSRVAHLDAATAGSTFLTDPAVDQRLPGRRERTATSSSSIRTRYRWFRGDQAEWILERCHR